MYQLHSLTINGRPLDVVLPPPPVEIQRSMARPVVPTLAALAGVNASVRIRCTLCGSEWTADGTEVADLQCAGCHQQAQLRAAEALRLLERAVRPALEAVRRELVGGHHVP